MTENAIAAKILDSAFRVHKSLGPGLLESVYHSVRLYDLRKNGLRVQSNAPISKEGITRVVNGLEDQPAVPRRAVAPLREPPSSSGRR